MTDDTHFMAEPPPAPEGFDAAREFEGVAWYHDWEIFKGVRTPGRRSVSLVCAKADIPRDLSGKRVLDIGAWHGCFSFECERRGASEVVAYSLENPEVTGFRRLKALARLARELCSRLGLRVAPEEIGEFDLILFFGVLYHLRYPLLGIDRIRTVSRGDVLIETHTVTSRQLFARRSGCLRPHDPRRRCSATTPIWRQYREFELHPEDQSNWFGPNRAAVIESFETAGFRVAYLNSWDYGARSTFRASAVPVRRASPTKATRASRACTGTSPASIARK